MLCLCILWGSAVSAYAATNYDVEYYQGTAYHEKSMTGQTLYAGDTITQAPGSGGFKIVYRNTNGEDLSESATANHPVNREDRTITVESALKGYQAWKVISENETYEVVDEEGATIIYNKIILRPYGKIEDDQEPTKQEPVYIDRDTYKSELPAGTIMSYNATDRTKMIDLKVHETEKQNAANQQLLADAYMKTLGAKGANMIITKDIFPYRELAAAENGTKQELRWKNTGLPAGTVVYAVCYNQTDRVYYLQGIVDKDGTAVFENFIVREATTVSIVTAL